jgi:hypothetical protein
MSSAREEIQASVAAAESSGEADDPVATDIQPWSIRWADYRVGMSRHGKDRHGAGGAGVDRPNVYADVAVTHVGISQHGEDPHGTGTPGLAGRQATTGAALTCVGVSRHGDARHDPPTIDNVCALL